jgi:hypothetical protein
MQRLERVERENTELREALERYQRRTHLLWLGSGLAILVLGFWVFTPKNTSTLELDTLNVKKQLNVGGAKNPVEFTGGTVITPRSLTVGAFSVESSPNRDTLVNLHGFDVKRAVTFRSLQGDHDYQQTRETFGSQDTRLSNLESRIVQLQHETESAL